MSPRASDLLQPGTRPASKDHRAPSPWASVPLGLTSTVLPGLTPSVPGSLLLGSPFHAGDTASVASCEGRRGGQSLSPAGLSMSPLSLQTPQYLGCFGNTFPLEFRNRCSRPAGFQCCCQLVQSYPDFWFIVFDLPLPPSLLLSPSPSLPLSLPLSPSHPLPPSLPHWLWNSHSSSPSPCVLKFHSNVPQCGSFHPLRWGQGALNLETYVLQFWKIFLMISLRLLLSSSSIFPVLFLKLLLFELADGFSDFLLFSSLPFGRPLH